MTVSTGFSQETMRHADTSEMACPNASNISVCTPVKQAQEVKTIVLFP